MTTNTPECSMVARGGARPSPTICTMVFPHEYPLEVAALYGADGKIIEVDYGGNSLTGLALTEHDCEMLRLITVWDGAILRSTYDYDSGAIEWDYDFPDELGDWIDAPIPVMAPDGPEVAA